ncbi:TrlF family AAA-like ATPase [Marinifilum flexuosum]|uniref:AAA domain-containing protein n=1 Tax=Marinifilum flexuosum TaxID=1117708 RepID=A0A419WTE8_9BACT|nr:PHP domain-containing protein [Marinifilum flexuosum]RKD98749.1 AAA domain-containing protein [Marinifilum flexuosum]
MTYKIEFKGTRWYKCDFHIHTTASECFQDKEITAKQWVDKAIEKGLDCVAITDHNSSLGIDEIKEAAKEYGLTVFPGVELTCDTSKIHLLILFDTDKTSADVNYFLARTDIKSEDYGKQGTITTKSILQIAELAQNDGALVIPAHIDEYNGLGAISVDILKKLYSDYGINAVQVVHKEFLERGFQITGNSELKALLNNYYSNPNPAIDDATIKEWYTPVKYALEANLGILTFSDNPHEPNNSKHGLWGIGEKYSWIKMDKSPSLEGLRQAFLLPDFRVKNMFDSEDRPYILPDLWIKSLRISNTTVTDDSHPLQVEFSPQLNTIIGGRGSGKSSILRFIRGVFNRNEDIQTLNDILNDQVEFYKKTDNRTKKGVLTDTSVVEVEFVRNEELYKVSAENITSSTSQDISIFKFNYSLGDWEVEDSEGFIDFLQFEQYSQKQIYEIAQEPNSLRERIDNSIENFVQLKRDRQLLRTSFLEKAATLRTKYQQIAGKGKLQTEIKDIEEQIRKYQQSGISQLLTGREKFTTQKSTISNFMNKLKEKEDSLITLINDFQLEDINYVTFDKIHSDELSLYSKDTIDTFIQIKQGLENQRVKLNKARVDFSNNVVKSQWKKDFDVNQAELETKKQELEKAGINDIANFEKLNAAKEAKEKELASVVIIEQSIAQEIAQKDSFQEQYLLKTKEITSLRQSFVAQNMQDDRVKVSVKPFRNKTDFENKLRSILQRPNSYDTDIDNLISLCFQGNVEQKIKSVRKVFKDILAETTVTDVVISGHFINLVKGLSNEQIDEIELLLPEDEIEIQYKPTGASTFKPLSTASAGQKTTAILTFILSQGLIPLILDQPEDDLDNRLVYELVVDRLNKAKDHRQIIVVTHNANIPVNGDSEFIISMNSESKKLSKICSGSVEKAEIKKEICDVMEGSEKAFKMRYRRYEHIR